MPKNRKVTSKDGKVVLFNVGYFVCTCIVHCDCDNIQLVWTIQVISPVRPLAL